jgi:hypothetical protein
MIMIIWVKNVAQTYLGLHDGCPCRIGKVVAILGSGHYSSVFGSYNPIIN